MQHLPKNHPHIPSNKIGILLINLGTPEQATTSSVRRFLKEFLSDSRVIEVFKPLWWILLHFFILPLRSPIIAKTYQKIWDTKHDNSPLRVITMQQAQDLQDDLSQDNVVVTTGLCYSTPSIHDGLNTLKLSGCQKILAMALYPQYSATTTASAYDKVFKILLKERWQPTIRTLAPYYDHLDYINALLASLTPYLEKHNPDLVFLSFHGLPQSYADKGDPYYCHVQKTTRLLKEALPSKRIEVAFQSRFGKAQWLKPYSSELLVELANEGVENIVVLAPGFACDCIETIEEIKVELRDYFLNAGGKQFHYVPCLNTSNENRTLLHTLAKTNLQGWKS